ncbi:conserved putative membrane protein [Candidatus Protochlamydia naegleriophila]|uniref:Conserved putative membrane protein n=1 Tax=Candidatus Protochlamydia naegleriophila TaxID=389348 RepID=A0A0U5K4R3_9BACT|nr:type II CAAX endopeptidase family protein [Candidatus Protochlamydia naegleriophila]CUI17083.1 conserved putative membrane protein [Candidatus Protochlamydia naegleriophila]
MLEDHLIQEQLHQHIIVLIIGLILGCLAGYAAWQKGFFKGFVPTFLPLIKGKDVLKGFFVFCLAELIVVPALIVVAFYVTTGKVVDMTSFGEVAKGWINALIIFGGFLGVWRVYFDLRRDTRHQLWRQTDLTGYRQLLAGIEAWLISYPFVMIFGQVIAIAVLVIFREPTVDQVAVKHLKSILSDPLLFGITAFEVIVLVPFTEEVLFRGLLQNWLKSKFGHATGAVALTSLIFAVFHFSSTQGTTNIELLSSLFMLSCFLGFIYEKQRSLWASIGLHAFFNFISILLIFFS